MSAKLNICLISGAYPGVNDGIGDYTAKLIDNLNKEDLRISLVTSDDEAIRRQIKETTFYRIYPIIKNWNIFGVSAILKLIRKEKFNVVHLQFPSSRYKKTFSLCFLPLFLRLFFKDIKVITTLHEFSISYPVNKLRQLLLGLPSHRVIVTDKNDFEHLRKILMPGRKKITVIHIGSNIDVRGYDIKEKELFLEKLGLESRVRIIVFFGFIHPNKGIECLLEAVEKVIANGFKVHLLLISQLDSLKNTYHRKVENLIYSLGIKKSVFLTGYADSREVSKYLSFSDICVLPFTDGATLRRGTLMAALSHSKAVISTESAKNLAAELVNKENIFLVPICGASELSQAIELLLKDDKLRQKIEKGAGKLAESFSWDRIALTHQELYRGISVKP